MTLYFGIGALVIGCGMIAVGWNSGMKGKVILQGILLILSGTCIGVGGSPSKGAPNGSPMMEMLGVCGIVVTVVWIIISLSKNISVSKNLNQKKAESIGASALDRFFVECVLSEADDFSQEKNRQRAMLLADKYKISYPNGIENLYKQGLENHKIVSQRFTLNHIEELRNEESKMFDELNKYSDLTGKEKRIAMLSDRAAELRKKAKNQRDYADMLIRSGQQKEKDWAIWGGVANGLGGFGAGVSTAVDIQLQNAQIREENKRRMQAAMPGYMFMTGNASDNMQNADRIMKDIENFKLKLISEESQESLMSHITFANTDVLISETGSALVCTSASLDPDFKIFNDVPAIVDGTIIAKIYDGNTLCGTAQLVLPTYGLGQDIELQGICINCCDPEKHYSVEFVAKRLWALEK